MLGYRGLILAVAVTMLPLCSALAEEKAPNQTETMKQAARAFIERLDKGEYAKATEDFDAVMLKQAPPEGLKRIRNLRENPRVSIVIDEYEEDWTKLRYVIIQGCAELLTDGPQFSHGVDLLAAKYAQYRTLGLARERGLMIRVTPSRVSAWQYSS